MMITTTIIIRDLRYLGITNMLNLIKKKRKILYLIVKKKKQKKKHLAE